MLYTSGHQSGLVLSITNTSSPDCKTGLQSQYLGVDDLGRVYGAIEEARSEWYHIGLKLKISANDLDAIRRANHNDSNHCLTETPLIYLKRTDPEPTWGQLADALQSKLVGYSYLADKVRLSNT